MRPIAAVLLLLCGGCTTTPVEIYASDGRQALLVECTSTVARCHAAARERCAGAYTTVDQTVNASVVGGGGTVNTIQRFTLTFRCGGA